MSDDLGAEGRVVAEGRLECSGNYVVEEEEEEDDEEEDGGLRPAGVYRRLIFLKNEGVVQTEVNGGRTHRLHSWGGVKRTSMCFSVKRYLFFGVC